MAQVRQGLAGHGTAYFALEQTAGKGQRGKQWITEPRQNIMVSIVTRPGGTYDTAPFAFSASIALACYDFFKKYGSDDDTRIKWPNDLYWQDRKAGGVLVESLVVSRESLVGGADREAQDVKADQLRSDANREASDVSRETQDVDADQLQSDLNTKLSVNDSVNQGPLTSHASRLTIDQKQDKRTTIRYVIIGIGININQTRFDPSVKNPVSLKQITGKEWDPIVLAKELCEAIDLRYKQFLLLTPSEIVADYQSVLYKKDQRVRLKKENAVFETTVRGVTEDGRLKTVDVIEREWVWGDVQWVV